MTEQHSSWASLEKDLEQLLGLRGQAVGIKVVKDGYTISSDARKPSKQIDLCQLYQMARFHSITSYAEKEDIFCSRGSSALGLEPVPSDIIEGERDETGKAPDIDAAKFLQMNIPRLPLTEGYRGVVIFPLSDASVDPDVIVLTGNPAQMLRLCQATTFKRSGQRLRFQTSGTQALCADCIATVKLTNEPNMTTPCYGARYFAYFEDNEMMFAMPPEYVKGVVEGLKTTHEGGYPYPILHEYEVTPSDSASLTIARTVPEGAKHGDEITHVKSGSKRHEKSD
ncbi:MAG: DUF169 domain-containing protein [Candidatus Bathyarchaeia archaeon]